MLLETGVRYSHVLRPRHYHARTRLVHVVLHTEVRGHAVHQHPVVRGHVGKLVTDFLLVPGELYQIFLDFQQHRPILLITIYGLGDEMFQIYPCAVRIQFRTTICEEKGFVVLFFSFFPSLKIRRTNRCEIYVYTYIYRMKGILSESFNQLRKDEPRERQGETLSKLPWEEF